MPRKTQLLMFDGRARPITRPQLRFELAHLLQRGRLLDCSLTRQTWLKLNKNYATETSDTLIRNTSACDGPDEAWAAAAFADVDGLALALATGLRKLKAKVSRQIVILTFDNGPAHARGSGTRNFREQLFA
jgi:hypothetical protein